jgi:hypothetical protein
MAEVLAVPHEDLELKLDHGVHHVIQVSIPKNEIAIHVEVTSRHTAKAYCINVHDWSVIHMSCSCCLCSVAF